MSALSLSCQILLMFEAQHSPQARARLGGRGGEGRKSEGVMWP